MAEGVGVTVIPAIGRDGWQVGMLSGSRHVTVYADQDEAWDAAHQFALMLNSREAA